MVIIFAIVSCLVGLLVASLLYYYHYKTTNKNATTNEIELLRDGLNSYHRWQLNSFFYYCVFFAVLLTAIYYSFHHSIAWQVPVVFSIGILFSLIVVGAATHLSLGSERNVLTLGTTKNLFPIAFHGPALVGILSVSISYVGVLLVYLLFGVNFMVHYALGATLVTVFSLVNGGIFTKAMEISSHIVKKNYDKIKGNDQRNPSFWGERVGQTAVAIGGKVSSLMISYLFALIGAVMIIDHFAISKSISVAVARQLITYPFILYGVGLISILIGLAFTMINSKYNPLQRIVWGMYLTISVAAISIFVVNWFIPLEVVPAISLYSKNALFNTVMLGLLGAIIVSMVSEYYGSAANQPVRDLAEKSQYSPVNTLLGGIRSGMRSVFIPIIAIGSMIYLANKVGGVFAIGLAGTGMLSVIGSIIAGSTFSSDMINVGAMSTKDNVSAEIKGDLNRLDGFGSTINSVSLGYSSIASFLSSLILLLVLGQEIQQNTFLSYDYIAIFVVVGALVPYLFSYFIIKGINHTSIDAYQRSSNQLDHVPYLIEGKTMPDVVNLVKHVLQKAQLYTFTPAVLSLLFPLFIGLVYGKNELFIFLLGSLVSGLLLAVIFSNTGGMLYNAKKYIEAGNFGGVGTKTYDAACIGEMIGSPIKDAIAPSIDIFIKIMLAFALIMSPLFH